MPIMQPRYGRPRGTGLDDSRRLEDIAALLAANPALKPTTAIRSLGVEDPSVIRRLRDKFRMDQTRLLANARHRARDGQRTPGRAGRVRATTHRRPEGVRSNAPAVPMAPPATDIAVATAPSVPLLPSPLPAVLCEFGLWALTTAIEQHAVLARHWLQLPAVEIAMRNQLAYGAFIVAVSKPRKPPKPRIH